MRMVMKLQLISMKERKVYKVRSDRLEVIRSDLVLLHKQLLRLLLELTKRRTINRSAVVTDYKALVVSSFDNNLGNYYSLI